MTGNRGKAGARHRAARILYGAVSLTVGAWSAQACAQTATAVGAGGQEATVALALPDSPGTSMRQAATPSAKPQSSGTVSAPGEANDDASQRASALPPCDKQLGTTDDATGTKPGAAPGQQLSSAGTRPAPCQEKQVQPILSASTSHPLSSKQKGELAFRSTVDPFNLLTIGAYSGFAVVFNSHSAYGPGFEGWGKLSGYSLIEDAQGEFFGTYLISSLTHEDPRYHRMPDASVKKRILHALAHTWVSQHDDGRPMPNYATLLTYPFSAELSNLYVPGVPTNLRDTGERVAIGLATDPSGTLVAEFLPDFARKIHVHVIFIQEILNRVITGGTAPNVQ